MTIICFRWYEAVRYFPSWQEVTVTLMVVCGELWLFRWVVNRMPVFGTRHYRITSYNVCYTKLLRIAAIRCVVIMTPQFTVCRGIL